MEQSYVIFETRCIHKDFCAKQKILYRASDFISTFFTLSNLAIVFPNITQKLHIILFPYRARVGD